MARDPNPVEVKIRATSDTKGAKEAEKALDGVSRAAGKKSVAGRKGAAGNLEDVSKEGPKAAKSTRNAGFAALEASRAFEDMQYGIRGVLNNIPGLVMSLGGTAGVAGAASFAAVAASLLVPKLRELFGTAEEDSEALDELAERLEKVAKKAGEAARERQISANKEFERSIASAVEVLKLENNEFERSIRLIKAKRDAQIELLESEKQLALARVDADEGLTEEERIRRRSEIEISSSRARRGFGIDAINDQVRVAEQAFSQAIDQNAAKVQAVSGAERRLEEETERRNELQRRKVLADQVPELKKQLENLRITNKLRDRLIALDGDSAAQQEIIDQLPNSPNFRFQRDEARKVIDIQSRINEQRELISGAEISELEGFTGTEGKKGSLENLREEIEELKESARLSAIALSEAKRQLEAIDEIADIQRRSSVDTGRRGDETARIREEIGARGAREREEERRSAEEKRRLEEAVKEGESRLDQEASAASEVFERAAQVVRKDREGSRRALEKIARLLEDGTDARELERIAIEASRALGSSRSAEANFLRDLIGKLNRNSQEIETLRGQIKHARVGR
ncbi:MAG: hypothetical protein AAGB14_00300 [Verrucomicrobiota bacterium]